MNIERIVTESDDQGVPHRAVHLRFRNFDELARTLRKLSDVYQDNPTIRATARQIVFPAEKSRDELGQALAIGRWVQNSITYVHEGREHFQKPTTTLKLGTGDCDDFTLLICSLLSSIGIKNAMCILNVNGKWVHIFPIAIIKGRDGKMHRLTLDATLRQPIDDLANPIAILKDRGMAVIPKFV